MGLRTCLRREAARQAGGQKGLTTGRHALVEKKKGKYRLRDYAERGVEDAVLRTGWVYRRTGG
jgi:hypothetical protein